MEMALRERLRAYEDATRGVSSRGFEGLDYTCRQLFQDAMPLEGQRLLEVGGGDGYFSFWALASGAVSAVNLEPETAGSTSRIAARSREHCRALGLSDRQYRLVGQTLQEFPLQAAAFDLILTSSSINHLDEEACMALPGSTSARATYLDLFAKLHALLAPGGRLVVHDAARRNYWNALGMRSPFSPTIEWHKHQEPGVWRGLLEESGFRFRGLRWLRFHRLRALGPLNGSALVARATLSQFILTMERPTA